MEVWWSKGSADEPLTSRKGRKEKALTKTVSQGQLIGSLKYQDGYGGEDVAQNQISCSFNPHRSYSNWLTLSNASQVSWSYIPMNYLFPS